MPARARRHETKKGRNGEKEETSAKTGGTGAAAGRVQHPPQISDETFTLQKTSKGVRIMKIIAKLTVTWILATLLASRA